jgi:hypothetical protein
MAKSGLCAGCRSIAKQPKGGHAELTARRWLAPRYHELRRASSLRGEQIAQRALFLARQLRHTLPRPAILFWNLDNPYMAEEARRVMVNDAIRYCSSHRRKKPVASVRTLVTPQRKQAA